MTVPDELAHAEAVAVVTVLLEKLEREADYAAEAAEEWTSGSGANRQARLWQQEADEKNAQAVALRVVLGLPPRVKRDGDD